MLAAQHDCPKDMAVLLLARPTLLARLEQQSLQFLKEQRVIQFKSSDVRRGGGIEFLSISSRLERSVKSQPALLQALSALWLPWGCSWCSPAALLSFVNDHLAGLNPTSSDGDIASSSTLPKTGCRTRSYSFKRLITPGNKGVRRTPQPRH